MKLFGFGLIASSVLSVKLLALFFKGIDAIQDAPFTYSDDIYQKSIFCPQGITNQTGGIVFLVHGAATTGEGTWSGTPFNHQLANTSPGYDICWVNLPWKGLGDLQESAEYVAFGIKYLSSLSPATGNKINVIGHSQGGGASIQWALTFWPSLQPLVIRYFSIAGTFKGVWGAVPVCLLEQLWGGCMPSPLQLKTKSRYMAAQNSEVDGFSGAKAHVDTISVFSVYDQVLQWEGPHGKTSFLEGATMLNLQSRDLCGIDHFVGHLGIVEDQAAFNIIRAILPTDHKDFTAQISNFNKSSCNHLAALWRKVIFRWPYALHVGVNFATGPGRLHKIFNEFAHLRVTKEPGLQPYVCERGYATNCLPVGTGFPDLRK